LIEFIFLFENNKIKNTLFEFNINQSI